MKKLKIDLHNTMLLDDEDYYFLKGLEWRIEIHNGKDKYASTKRSRDFAQHYIMRVKKGKRIIFKDGNGLNLQKSNLRYAI